MITPKTKIYELLEKYPQAEDELIKLVPAFSKLKNPILRKTIARVTTIQQAAMVGGVDIGIIINKLREIAGDDAVNFPIEEISANTNHPDWFDNNKIVRTLDARPLLARGEHPMELVSKECRALNKGEIFELITGFYPAPLIEMMKNKGFEVFHLQGNDDLFHTFFSKTD